MAEVWLVSGMERVMELNRELRGMTFYGDVRLHVSDGLCLFIVNEGLEPLEAEVRLKGPGKLYGYFRFEVAKATASEVRANLNRVAMLLRTEAMA